MAAAARLLNPDNNRKVEFDADIISDDMADVLFKVPVWGRVMVTSESGTEGGTPCRVAPALWWRVGDGL